MDVSSLNAEASTRTRLEEGFVNRFLGHGFYEWLAVFCNQA